jgi:hypothetical protein
MPWQAADVDVDAFCESDRRVYRVLSKVPL